MRPGLALPRLGPGLPPAAETERETDTRGERRQILRHALSGGLQLLSASDPRTALDTIFDIRVVELFMVMPSGVQP